MSNGGIKLVGMHMSVLFGLPVIFIASMIQGVTGFGFALVAVPLLSMISMPLARITPLIVFYSLLTNLLVIYEVRKHIELKRILLLIVFALLGTPFGVHILKIVSARHLKVSIAVIIIVTATALYKNYKIQFKNEKFTAAVVGVLSGLLNGSVGLSGPPVVLFLTNQGVDKQVFRANLVLFGIVTNIFAIGNFLIGGMLSAEAAGNMAVLLPGLILGGVIGVRIARLIKETLFRKITIGLILFLGISILFTTIFV